MKNIIFTSTFLLFTLAYLVCSENSNTETTYVPITSINTIKMPIEVIGEEGKIVERTFTIDNQTFNNTSKIWLMVNNLSYQNKGSVKINNGDWLSLNHQTATLETPEMQRGGMVHGGYNTIRFTIPPTGLITGTNTIKFRFNTSDGISIGYRVIRMNLINTSGTKLLADSNFEQDNPNNWVAPLPDQASINKGKDLWYNANLWSTYLPNERKGFWYGQELPASKPMKAKCTSCHTQDGRDLEMFSYSNESIIERAKFHKLTEEQGKQIASYIRSLSSEIDKVGRYGRPWNPPYQPGPSIKNKPIEQWAAGAGIDAVLNEDKDMLPYLFPDGVSKEKVRSVFDSDKMTDRTTLPIAIQFPDWKHWLPIIHPLDAYSKSNYITNIANNKPLKAIEDTRAYLVSKNAGVNPPSDLFTQLRKMWTPFRKFNEEGASGALNHWRTTGGNADTYRADGISRDVANTSLARLLAVKNFEFMNEFNLQDKAHLYTNAEDQPGERQWASNAYSVFEVPPHFTAVNTKNYDTQPRATGRYESTAWYTLQFVLNGGNGVVGGTQPTDFNYHHQHIAYASADAGGINESLRYFSSISQTYQIRSWSKSTGPGEKGYKLKQQGPYHFVGIHQGSGFYFNPPQKIVYQLDEAMPGLSKLITEALLLQFMQEMKRPENNLNSWPRKSPDGGNSELDPINKSSVRDISTFGAKYHNADKMYYIIPIFKEIGVDCDVLNEFVDWCKRAWPQIDFEKFTENNCTVVDCTPTEISSKTIYKIKTKHDKCVQAVESNGYTITQQDCNDSDTGKWILENADAGYYYIKNLNSGQYIQSTGINNGDQVEEAAFSGTDPQKWGITETNNCKFNIIAKNANKCLDLKSGNSANGTHFQLWSCNINGKENREYTFEFVDEVNDPEYTISITRSTDAIEGSTDASFTVSLDQNVNNTSGNPITGSITLTGTATEGTDYTNITSFSIPNGANRTQIIIPVVDDNEMEDSETIIATISNPSLGDISTNNSATATIEDNDQEPVLNISITKTTDATEGATDATFTVSIDQGANNTGSAITGTVTLTGTAAQGTDYTNITSFNIPNGENSMIVTIPVINDNRIEDPETIIATISNPIKGVISANSSATATITDDDKNNATLSIQPIRGGTEGTINAAFTVALSDNLINATQDNITGVLSLTGNAESGIDYIDVNSFSIPIGSNSIEIEIPIVDDTLIENIEIINATISEPSIGSIGSIGTTSVFIEDDDKNNVTLSIITISDAVEGGANATFEIMLDNNLINSTQSNITGTISLLGTATQGTDYNTITSFSIPNGENQTQIILPIIDDNEIENSETIIATISNPNIGDISANNSATATIDDNDTSASCENPVDISAGYVYHITTRHDKYISAITSGGYTITQQSSNQTDTSKWVLEDADAGYYFIRNLSTSRYMQTTGTTNGTHIQEALFSGDNTQQWEINATVDCKFTIVSKSANKCLDLKSGNNADGTRFQIWSCGNTNNTENREYTFESLGEDTSCNAAAINNNDIYNIKTKHDKYIEVAGNSSSNGNNVQQWESTERDNQKWQLNDQGNGYYLIRNIRSNKCMDVSNNTGNGINIKEWRCHGKNNQQWKITLLDNCTYQIRSRANNKCIDLNGGHESNGANIQQWSCRDDNENQQFSFELLRGDRGFGLGDIVASEILVFPNPTNSVLNVKIPSNTLNKSSKVRVYNFMGKLIKEETTKEELISMSLENLPTGNYIVRVISNKQTYDKVIVKE